MSSIKFSVFFILVIFLSFGISTSSKISNFSSNTKRKLVENLDSVAICLDAKSKIYHYYSSGKQISFDKHINDGNAVSCFFNFRNQLLIS